jgi:hypothetical protein
VFCNFIGCLLLKKVAARLTMGFAVRAVMQAIITLLVCQPSTADQSLRDMLYHAADELSASQMLSDFSANGFSFEAPEGNAYSLPRFEM